MLEMKNLTFTYTNREIPALREINLAINHGEFCTIFGASGCGKTTLLRHFNPLTTPNGTKSGVVNFHDQIIGFVSQSPENQIVTDKVWHELAFGLESLGLPTSEIRLRTAEIASFFGIQEWFHKPVAELSGGQKQILVLASVTAMQPSALVLDEPTSQLDPIAAGEFLAMLGKINNDLGITIIMSEHRLEDVFPLSSRAIAMDDGQVIADGTPREVGLTLRGHEIFTAMPTPMRVWVACTTNDAEIPMTVREGAAWLALQTIHNTIPQDPPQKTNQTPAITINNAHFKYEKDQPDVIKGLSFQANYGEVTAVLGGNGVGKTTTLHLIAGIHKPQRGKIHRDNAVYALPQNPQALFSEKTVREDLSDILPPNSHHKLDEITKLCRIENLLEHHPHDLSGGEQQRAALAKVLLLEPKILLLDEPTKGLDANFKQQLAQILQSLKQNNTAIIIVSHDLEFCAKYADTCALFFDGTIITQSTPRKFFSANAFYTTAASRMSRQVINNAVTAQDIVYCLNKAVGVSSPYSVGYKFEPTEYDFPNEDKNKIVHTHDFNEKFSSSFFRSSVSQSRYFGLPRFFEAHFKSLWGVIQTSSVLILILPLLTILAGMFLLNDRQFYFISGLIIVQAMLPFIFAFERKKPKTHEIVTIATLCAIAVASRAAFFMLPQFKPIVAIIIVSGVALGGHKGFLVGAITAFASNMFFGQGPWTPWQMFALGIIGFFAGFLPKKPLILSIYGAFATFFVYGGIMNTASVLIAQPTQTVEMFILSFVYGVPFDLIHTAATVFFLQLIARPMLDKLERHIIQTPV